MASWRDLEAMVDEAVDGQFAEIVELHPWAGAGVEDEGGPDPNRPPLTTIGILVMPGAVATGEGGSMASGMSTRVVTNDVWLSITERNLKGSDLASWKEGDRVYFPDRKQWYTVTYPTPSVTARPNIYLARMQNA